MLKREVQHVKRTVTNRDPLPTDDVDQGYVHSSLWINNTTDDGFVCTNPAAGSAVWKKVGA